MTPEMRKQIEAACDDDGCESLSDFARIAIAEKLSRYKRDELIMGNIKEQTRRLRYIDQGQRLTFSAVAGFLRLFMNYFPEPEGDRLTLAQMTLDERYQRMMRDISTIFHTDGKKFVDQHIPPHDKAAAASQAG